LEIKWQTEPLLNNGWVVRADVPSEVVERFARYLFSLQDEAEGRKLLQAVPVSRFESANDETYQPVRQFLEYFSRSVRSIEQCVYFLEFMAIVVANFLAETISCGFRQCGPGRYADTHGFVTQAATSISE
jgi:hypothetical protein